MRYLGLITISAAILSFGLTLGASPQPAEAGACANISGVPNKACVTKRDLQADAVTSGKVLNESLTGADIKDGSIGRRDLNFDPGTSSGGSMVFVGYSTDIVAGDAGIVGLTQACHGDFGTTARICTPKEFILSSDIAAPLTAAWLNLDLDFISHYLTDAGNLNQLTCAFWSSASADSGSFRGLAVLPNGQVSGPGSVASNQRSCDVARPVTCCAPAPCLR